MHLFDLFSQPSCKSGHEWVKKCCHSGVGRFLNVFWYAYLFTIFLNVYSTLFMVTFPKTLPVVKRNQGRKVKQTRWFLGCMSIWLYPQLSCPLLYGWHASSPDILNGILAGIKPTNPLPTRFYSRTVNVTGINNSVWARHETSCQDAYYELSFSQHWIETI